MKAPDWAGGAIADFKVKDRVFDPKASIKQGRQTGLKLSDNAMDGWLGGLSVVNAGCLGKAGKAVRCRRGFPVGVMRI